MRITDEFQKTGTSSTSFPGGFRSLSNSNQASIGSSRTQSTLSAPKQYTETIYSRDSTIEKVDERDNDENDPEDERTKQYLDTHFEGMGLPGKQPMQMYADLKVSEVLTRGTIAEHKMRARLERLKKTLPASKVMTIDYQEARKIDKEIVQRVVELNSLKSRKELLEDTKTLIETVFNEETLRFGEYGIDDPVGVRELAAGLDSATSDDGSSEDETFNLIAPTNLREPSIKETHDIAVLERKLVMALKKDVYLGVKSLVEMMKADQDIMKHKLFRIWLTRQEEALEIMKKDVEYDELVEVNLESVWNEKPVRCEKSKDKGGNYEEEDYSQEGPVINDNMWRRSLKYIHEREKLLEETCDGSFLDGVLSGNLQVEGKLRKHRSPVSESTNIDSSGLTPLPLQGNEKVMRALGSCLESKMRLFSYGDLIRLLNGDGSFTLESEAPGETGNEAEKSEDMTSSPEIDRINKQYDSIACPVLTRAEFDRYNEIISNEMFPDPNFSLLESVLTFDENAFPLDDRTPVKMNLSLEQLENKTLKSLNLNKYLFRSIYFFKYKSEFSAADVRDEFERYILQNNTMDVDGGDHPNGCLLLYSNVALGTVMIEGKPLHIFNHFAGLRYSKVYPFIETGRVLYVEENVTELVFSLWVSIVAVPDTGRVSYTTNNKKVLDRVAKPRAQELKRNLHELYGKIAESEPSKMLSGNNFTEHLELLFEKCACHQSKKPDVGDAELPSSDLLPSPATLVYLLQYKKLKSINRFLDELFMQPILESDDETYDVAEPSVLSNFIDSDDESSAQDILRQMKRACKERKVVGELYSQLKANLMKENAGVAPVWVQKYDVKAFTPKLGKVQFRPAGRDSVPAISVKSLAESDDEEPEDENGNFVDLGSNAKLIPAWRKFTNFVETGSEAWQKKVKWLDLPGRELKEMLKDAHRYKELRKAVQMSGDAMSEPSYRFAEEGYGEVVDEQVEEEVVAEEETSHMEFGCEIYGEGMIPEVSPFFVDNSEQFGEYRGIYRREDLGEYRSEISNSPWVAKLGAYESAGEIEDVIDENLVDETLLINQYENLTSEFSLTNREENVTSEISLSNREENTTSEILMAIEEENSEILLSNQEESTADENSQINIVQGAVDSNPPQITSSSDHSKPTTSAENT